MPADLTTLANVKGYLPNITSNAYDTLLSRLITAASAWIRSYLNREITSATYTETLDGTGTGKIVVGQYPVTSVSAVSTTSGGVTTTVPLSSVVARQGTLALTDGTKWPQGFGNVSVTYTAGFTTIPADIEQACIDLVCWKFRERERVGMASKSLQAGGEVESYQTQDIPNNMKTLLNNWRRVVQA